MRCPSKFLWTPTTRNDFSSSSLFCKFPLIKGYEREEIHQSIQSCWCSTIMPFCLYIEHYSTFIDKSNFFFHSTFHSWRIIGATLELDLERNDLRNCQYLLIIDKHWRHGGLLDKYSGSTHTEMNGHLQFSTTISVFLHTFKTFKS